MTDPTPPPDPGARTTDAGESATTPQRALLMPVLGAAVFIGASIAFARAATPLLDIIGIVVFAGIVAWLNAPLLAWLTPFLRRTGATLLIVGVEIAGVSVAAALVLGDLEDFFGSVSRSVHRSLAVHGAHGTLANRLEHALRLGDGVQSWLSTLPQRLFFNSATTPAAGQRFVDLLVVAVLTAFFMASGPAIIAGIVALWRREERDGAWELLHDVDRRAGHYLRRAALVGLAGGIAVAAIAGIADVPYPFALGAWAAFWVPIPRLGVWVASVPLIAAALRLDPGPIAIALLGAALVVAAGVYAARRADPAGLRPGAALVLTAAAAGVATSGAGAAVLFVVLAVIAAAMWASPHRGVGLPLPAVTDDDVYRIGPLLFPKGLYGLVWSAAIVAITTLIWFSVVRAASVFIWISVAVLVAIAVDRPIELLTARLRVPRGVGLGVAFAIGIGLTCALVISVVSQGPPAVGKALERVPAVVREAEHLPFVGDSIRSHDFARTVAKELDRLPERVTNGNGAAEWFPSFGSQLVDLMWVGLLISAYLIDGRRLISRVERRIPAAYRRQADRLGSVSYGALAGFARGSLLVALLCGSVVLVLGLSLGIGLALVAALWAFVWDLVPQVGGIVGGIPLLLFAIAVSPAAFLIALGVYAVYQLIESNVIFPAIIGDNVELPGWAALVAVLAGAAAAGVIGAVVLTPVVAAIRLIVREYRSEDFPGRVSTS